MKQRKSPALTSPWKIGLLVSLLIATTGVGVTFLLTRAWNIRWSWVTLEPGNYAFHLDRFLDQMFPQVALVLGVCMLAYFTITSAVRRYRSYLDSGLDYKHLINSLHRVGDLDDESALRKLSKYPELKCFLGELRDELKKRDTLIEQQRSDLEAHAHLAESEDRLRSDCSALAAAIREKIAKGERRELGLDLDSPELQEIANAILEIPIARKTVCGEEEKTRMAELHQDLREASDFITGRLEDISRDLLGSSQEARNIESQINALKQTVDPAADAGESGEKIETLDRMSTGLAEVTRLSEMLLELSEDTRSIAINSALQAGSGEGTPADLIQLAEDVKEIAKKYEQSAVSYRTVTDDLSARLSVLDKLLRDTNANPEAIVSSTVNTLSGKMSLWVERILVLSDKMKTLEKSYRVSFQTLEERISSYAELNREDADSFEIEKSGAQELLQASFDTQPAGSVPIGEDAGEASGGEESAFSVEQETSAETLHLDRSGPDPARTAAPPSAIDGIVTERSIFENSQEEEESYFADKSIEIKDQFDKIESGTSGRVEDTTAETHAPAGHDPQDFGAVRFNAEDIGRDGDEVCAEADGGEAHAEADGLEAHVEADGAEARAEADGPDGGLPDESPMDSHEAEEEIIDLYALGAVDYVAHHSEQQP